MRAFPRALPLLPFRRARYDTEPAGEVAIPPRAVQREPLLRILVSWKRGFTFAFCYFFLWDLNPVLCVRLLQVPLFIPGRPEGRPGLPTCLLQNYWSNLSTEFGSELACANMAVPVWTRMLYFAYCVLSCATSTSMMALFAAARLVFSVES